MAELDVTVSASHCVVEVVGLDFRCPGCQKLVRSGKRHECVNGKEISGDRKQEKSKAVTR